MFEKFGEFSSCDEINELAENLYNEGDLDSIKALAKENGLPEEYADLYIQGSIPFLCDAIAAALGKIEVEANELKPEDIMEDWTEYLRGQVMESDIVARKVREKGKSLKGMIGALLAWSFKHRKTVDKDIVKAAGINAGKVDLGIPGMGTAKKIILNYYLEE